MPNWCDNRMTVEGPPDDVRAFVECVKDRSDAEHIQPISFERLVPTPPCSTDDEVAKLLGRNSAGDMNYQGMPDWYWWRVEHWGTKWDACDARLTYEEGATEAEYYYNTAWAPPEQWVRTVATMFPNLRFTLSYVEEGMGFAGYLVCRGQETIEQEVEIPSLTAEQYENGEGFWACDIEVPAGIFPAAFETEVKS